MASNAETAALQQTIVAEARTVQQFVDLLKLEQAALSSGAIDALPEYAEQKLKFAAQLEELATQRNATLGLQGFDANRAGVESWCAKHPSEEITLTAWAAILSQGAEARELNRLNGDLIHLRMQYNAKALEALRGGNSALDLYGPDGQSRTSGQRRINQSV